MILFMREREFRRRVRNIALQMIKDEEDCRVLEKELQELYIKLCSATGESLNHGPILRDVCQMPFEKFRICASDQKLKMMLKLATKRNEESKHELS